MDRLACDLIEVKFAPDSDAATMEFSGYGAVFGNIDAYGDVIAPGAFGAYLADVGAGKQSWPLMLSQHGAMGLTSEDMTPIGVWTDLAEDGNGLRVQGRLADTPRGREMYQLMKMTPRPAVSGLSIGYIAKEATPRTRLEEPRRTLKRIDLVEISVVSRPANALARVASVKSIEELSTIREVEEYMRERGLTKAEAVALISRIKGTNAGDPGVFSGGPGDPVADELMASLRRRIQAIAS